MQFLAESAYRLANRLEEIVGRIELQEYELARGAALEGRLELQALTYLARNYRLSLLPANHQLIVVPIWLRVVAADRVSPLVGRDEVCVLPASALLPERYPVRRIAS